MLMGVRQNFEYPDSALAGTPDPAGLATRLEQFMRASKTDAHPVLIHNAGNAMIV
jgi:hypothetical protein